MGIESVVQVNINPARQVDINPARQVTPDQWPHKFSMSAERLHLGFFTLSISVHQKYIKYLVGSTFAGPLCHSFYALKFHGHIHACISLVYVSNHLYFLVISCYITASRLPTTHAHSLEVTYLPLLEVLK